MLLKNLYPNFSYGGSAILRKAEAQSCDLQTVDFPLLPGFCIFIWADLCPEMQLSSIVREREMVNSRKELLVFYANAQSYVSLGLFYHSLRKVVKRIYKEQRAIVPSERSREQSRCLGALLIALCSLCSFSSVVLLFLHL